MRPKRTPKACVHHMNQGFSTEGQRWTLRWSAKQEITGTDPSTPKKVQRTLVIHFFILSVGSPVWICLLFFILWCHFLLLFSFKSTFSLQSSGWNLFLLWFKLHLIVSVTSALSYQSLLHPQKSREWGLAGCHQSLSKMDPTTVDYGLLHDKVPT